MSAPLTELKTRARLMLNASKRDQSAAGAPQAGHGAELRLRDCLNRAARDAGFTHWDHARRILGGLAAPADDMGTFWHAPACHALLNAWFTDADRARTALAATRGGFLLPYKRQFVVTQDQYIREMGLDPADTAWATLRRDLVAGYGSPAWAELAARRLKAPRRTFHQ